ncbi:Long-chain base-1-phosphate phosphatase [Coemansia sp. RSA 451]|nr:Long-chain base-1-phosphate phosphatase [Coemansia sp. RSA 451]
MPPHFQLDEDNDVIHDAEAFSLATESAYQAAYSPLRLYLRQLVVDKVKRENPKLAAIQHRYRSPELDRLFVFSGMLGNHSFFMIALPFLHTFGMGAFARGLTFVVLWSIYFSGFVKDYISAPRPASPPVVQITRSPAHTLEYGFPSTHTTYAVATIVYISHFMLNVWHISTVWVGLMWICGVTIVVGRIYCGLHSFIDVVGGIVIGIIEALCFVFFFDRLDALMLSTAGPLYSIAIFYFAMSSIPRSLDPCPCCIDSFCATSVTLGLSIGYWIHARLPFLWHTGQSDAISWDPSLTLTQNALRCLITIVLVVAWKVGSKPFIVSMVKYLVPDYLSQVSSEECSDDSSAKDSDSDCKQDCYVAPTASNIKNRRYGSYALMVSHENLARIPIYSGIPITMCVVSPLLFYMFGLMPSS